MKKRPGLAHFLKKVHAHEHSLSMCILRRSLWSKWCLAKCSLSKCHFTLFVEIVKNYFLLFYSRSKNVVAGEKQWDRKRRFVIRLGEFVTRLGDFESKNVILWPDWVILWQDWAILWPKMTFCGQIGRFLRGAFNNFKYKSSPNFWPLLQLIWKKSLFKFWSKRTLAKLGQFWKLFIPISGHTGEKQVPTRRPKFRVAVVVAVVVDS